MSPSEQQRCETTSSASGSQEKTPSPEQRGGDTRRALTLCPVLAMMALSGYALNTG